MDSTTENLISDRAKVDAAHNILLSLTDLRAPDIEAVLRAINDVEYRLDRERETILSAEPE